MTEEQPDDLTDMTHTDPEFFLKYDFCRIHCAACDRLDQMELANGKTHQQIAADAVVMAMKALDAGETM